MPLITAGTVVLEQRLCRPGWVHTSGSQIVDCGSGSAPHPPDVDLPDAVVVPGFVDIHVHGGGGASYTDGNTSDNCAQRVFTAHGTTTTLASLVTASPADLLAAVRALAESTAEGVIAGIHLEGPWLSAVHCGAHDHTQLRDPAPTEIDALLAAGNGAIKMVTLAPERPGSDAAIIRLVDAGVVVGLGHTDASYEQTRHAIELGATVGTHLFNAMRPLHHREPGPALALLKDRPGDCGVGRRRCARPPCRGACHDRAGRADRVALVTDATAAAGVGDGEFQLGAIPVDVVDGVARVRGTSTIAGSTATIDQLFRLLRVSAQTGTPR